MKSMVAKHTGEGEFSTLEKRLAAIHNKDFGRYVYPTLKTVPVGYLVTLNITGGNSVRRA